MNYSEIEYDKKIPIKVKLVCAVGEIGKSSLTNMNMFFLLYFYTDIVKIPAGIAALVLLAGRVWDAVNDPLMGILVDKTVSKEGKCRFYLKYFAVLAGLSLTLSYFVPEFSKNGKIIWVVVTYIFQGMAATVTTVPLNTLTARLTRNRLEKVSIGQYKAFGALLVSFVVPAVTLPLARLLGKGDLQCGFKWIALILGVLYGICHLIAWWGTKGYEPSGLEEIKENNKPTGKQELTVRNILKAVARNKYCQAVCFSYICFLILASLVGGTLVYYLQYNLGNTGLMAAYSTISTFFSIIPIFFMKKLSAKFGNSKTCVYAALFALLGYVIRIVVHDQFVPVLLLCWALEGIGTGLFSSLFFQCIMDSMIYGKWKSGIDTEGAIMSVFTFSQKTGSALGGVISAYLLNLVYYEPGAAVQGKTVLNMIYAQNVLMPAALYAVIIIIFLYIVIMEKKIPAMQKEIIKK